MAFLHYKRFLKLGFASTVLTLCNTSSIAQVSPPNAADLDGLLQNRSGSSELRNTAVLSSTDFYNQLRTSSVPLQDISFYAIPVNGAQPLFTHNALRAQSPASIIKLVTTFTVLKHFGADYHWQTQLLSTGSPDAQGVLHEPLYIRGSGDPQLVIERIQELVYRLAQSGVKQVDAPIIVDRSIYDLEKSDPSQFDGEPTKPYNALPDAALLNYRAVSAAFDPISQTVKLVPAMHHFPLSNTVQWVDGACPAAGWKSTLSFSMTANSAQVSGRYYSGCGAQNWYQHAYLMNENEYASHVFAALMDGQTPLDATTPAKTILWTQTRVLEGHVPAHAKVLANIESPALGAMLKDMNHFSNNVMARQFFLSLSVKDRGIGRLHDSEPILMKQLRDNGLHMGSLHIGNGSGLSRVTTISASDMAQMLVKANQDSAFVQSLPLLGLEGTVRNRLLNTDMVGRGRIKTGSLDDVSSIAGYIDGKSGRRYAVVSITNSANAHSPQVRKLQDDFMAWVGTH